MIQAEHLTKRYRDKTAVNDVTLSVHVGETVVLLGGSGSGKTTTLKMLNRLIEPTDGEVWLDGTNTTQVPPHELRRRIGYVFQQVGLFPHMTVSENIGVTPKLLKWSPNHILARIEELLSLLDLEKSLLERQPHELSGGQQQRVGVARALAAHPDVMLLDEPFGALDQITRERLQDSYLRIRKTLSLTSIFVTHDIGEAITLGDRIGVMHHGRLLQLASPSELVANPANNYVRELMNSPRRQAARVEALSSNRDKNLADQPNG